MDFGGNWRIVLWRESMEGAKAVLPDTEVLKKEAIEVIFLINIG